MSSPFAPEQISFRPLTSADLPLMVRWLNTPHVRAWWQDDPRTLEEVTAEYAPNIANPTRTACYVILHDTRPVGYIQTYRIADYPEYAQVVDVDEGAAGVDLFIGEEDYIHRGLGPLALSSFVREIVFARSGITSCVIGPAVGNAAAIRAYAKAGFHHVKMVQVPGEDEPEDIMRLTREDLERTL